MRVRGVPDIILNRIRKSISGPGHPSTKRVRSPTCELSKDTTLIPRLPSLHLTDY